MQIDAKTNAAAAEHLSTEDLARRGLEILVKRRWWFVFTVVAVFSVAIVVTRHQSPVYKATGLLHIDLSPPKVLSEVNEVVTLGSSGYTGVRQYYQAQIQILQSRDVAAMVVTRMGLARSEKFLGLDDKNLKITQKQKEAIMADADPTGMLSKRVLVELADDSSVAKVSIEDTDPEFAKDLANAVMQAYKDRNIDQKRRTVRDAYTDLRSIHKQLEQNKAASQQALFKFEKEHDLSENRRLAVNERLLSLSRQIREVHTTRLRAQQDTAQLKKFRGSQDIFAASAPSIMKDGLTAELTRRYLELSLKRKELETVYMEKHPKVMTVEDEMRQLVAIGSKHATSMYDAAMQQYAAAAAEEEDLIDQAKRAKEEDAEIRLTKIQHDQLIAKAEEDKMFYEKVAKRLAETDMTERVNINNISILDQAVTPRVPVRPNVQLNLLMGLLLALVAGLAVALTVDMMDNTIKTRFDVEQVLGVPYLGAIPTFSPANLEEGAKIPDNKLDLYAHFRPNSRVAEASRSVRTNLLFMRPDRPLRTLLITSANPREGKTSTSATLAITLAASTGKCILVDTDLRKPRLHKVFGVPATVGVTNYILSRDEVDNFVTHTEVPGLDILLCGPLPPNPSEILHTDRFKQLVAELQSKYETVIFDSPPVEIVSDALVIASLVDGVVIVAHCERSTRESVRSAVTSLRSVQANLMGIVLSRTSIRGAGYGYYYNGRYRRGQYRYRYAADRDDTSIVRDVVKANEDNEAA